MGPLHNDSTIPTIRRPNLYQNLVTRTAESGRARAGTSGPCVERPRFAASFRSLCRATLSWWTFPGGISVRHVWSTISDGPAKLRLR